MRTIVPFPEGPERPTPENHSERPMLPAAACATWCLANNGHPDAVHEAERTCRSYVHRIDAAQGGGSSDDYGVTSPGSLVMQVERQPGQAPTIIVGVQLMDREHYVRLSVPEFMNALLYSNVALFQAQTA